MANERNSNTFYVDSSVASASATASGNLVAANLKLLGIVVSSSSAGAIAELHDVSTDDVKLRVHLAASSSSQYMDFSRRPIIFPNGISPRTLTNCVVTCIIEESRA